MASETDLTPKSFSVGHLEASMLAGIHMGNLSFSHGIEHSKYYLFSFPLVLSFGAPKL